MRSRGFLLAVVAAWYAATGGLPQASAGPSSADSERLFPFCEDGKWGYIDRDGKVAIGPQYRQAADFSDGLAYVEIAGGRRAFIDTRGQTAWEIPPGWQEVRSLWGNGCAFSEGRCAFSVNGKWGFVDREGRIVVAPRYDAVGAFSNGLAQVNLGLRVAGDYCVAVGVWGFIDRTGRVVVEPKHYYSANDFSEGLAAVWWDGGFGYLDTTGKLVFR